MIPYDVLMGSPEHDSLQTARPPLPLTTQARLRALFGHILAATSGLVVACGGTTVDGAGGSNDPTAPRSMCGSGRPPFPAGLTASPRQDYVASRSESAYLQGAADGGEGVEAFTSRTTNPSGTPCATASNVVECQSRLDTLRVLPRTREECETKFPNVAHPIGARSGCRVSYLVFTRGDEVGVAIGDAEVRAFMGAIDTVQEADWLLRKSYDPTCGGAKGQGFTVREVDGGFEFVFVNNCEKAAVVRTVVVARDGTVTEAPLTKAPAGTEFSCAVAGRRPAGLSIAHVTAPRQLAPCGAYFATMAELEAAAVLAFRRLHRELANLGAPHELLSRIREATRDEIRHTRATRAIARRDGIEPRAVIVKRSEMRDAFALALENAREGCVRETYGALLAWHQAASSEDVAVRSTMESIAGDETAHAALSADIATWLDALLSAEERERVALERSAAFAELRSELDLYVPPTLQRSAGLPSRERALSMLTALRLATG